MQSDPPSRKWRVTRPQVRTLDLTFTMQWPPAAPSLDLIQIENLRVEANIGLDCWKRSRPQPLLISVALQADVKQAAQNDDLTNSPNYGKLAKEIKSMFKSEPDNVYEGMEALAEVVAKLAVTKLANPSYSVRVSVKAPQLLLHDTIVALEIDRSTDTSDQWGKHWKWSIENWKVPALIGMNPPERETKQIVIINLQLFVLTTGTIAENRTTSLPQILDRLLQYINASSFQTLEKFTTRMIWCVLANNSGIRTCIAKVSKPSAIIGADASAVQIRRDRHEYLEMVYST